MKGKKKNFETLNRAIDVLGIADKAREYIIDMYTKNPFEDFIVYEFLSQDQLTNMEINLPYLPDVYVVEGEARYYKNDFQSVGQAIRDMLNSYRLTHKFDEAKLIDSWERLVGKPIAKRTKKIYIKKYSSLILN